VNTRTLLAIGLSLVTAFAYAQTRLEKISGDVVALDNGVLQIKAGTASPTAVKLGNNARITVRMPTDFAKLAPGMYLGTTAVPQPDGTLLASEVHVFPEAQRGNGEGHRPMDTPGNTMTNATVSKVGEGAAPRNTMTNATVANVAGGARARSMTLTYNGGEKVVIVPEGIPILLGEVGDRSLLIPGAHVVVYASRQPDGSLTTERVSVGRGDYVPPL